MKLVFTAGRRNWFCVLLLLALGMTGCADPSATQVPPPLATAEDGGSDDIPSAPSLETDDTTPDTARVRKFDGIRFTVPAGFKEIKLADSQRGFIDARFEIPDVSPQLKLTCSSVGGGIDSNVDRWEGQFSNAEVSRDKLVVDDDTEVVWVDIRGGFNDRMGTTQSDWRMLGAAIPMQPRDFYLKLTGPRPDVSEVEEQFRSFVRSARLD